MLPETAPPLSNSEALPVSASLLVTDAASFQAATGATHAQMADIEAYRLILADWNSRMNLVGPSAMAEFWGRHAFDSAQLLALAPDARLWADLGAGAGFPGLILAILLRQTPGARVHLVETLAKRCRFLSAVVSELALPAVVHNSRAELMSLKVDRVVARAFAPMVRLLGHAQPYFKAGAIGLFLKGEGVDAELAEATKDWSFQARQFPSRSDPRGRIVEIKRLYRAQS
jgi:16S rRNA (guanine527-N7)-methyltransferase